MKINYPLIEARFIDRPNRFLTRLEYNGNIIQSHLPDPGRLKELLKPGVRVLIKKEKGNNRKTAFSTQAVFCGDVLVSLNTLLPNKFVEYLLMNNKIEFLKKWKIDKREVPYNNHRFDFKLSNGSDVLFLEVKSVTLIQDNIAKFPDAITKRGKEHVKQLGIMSEQGISTMVLFVVQRHDAILFMPQWDTDTKFCSSLLTAWEQGLIIKVIKMKMTYDKINYLGEIPFELEKNT